jgi:hypothetical protein
MGNETTNNLYSMYTLQINITVVQTGPSGIIYHTCNTYHDTYHRHLRPIAPKEPNEEASKMTSQVHTAEVWQKSISKWFLIVHSAEVERCHSNNHGC